MECSLATLIACFSWSGFYIDGGLLYQDGGEHFTTARVASTIVVDGANVSQLDTRSTSSINAARNPYGRLELGYQVDFRNVSWRLYAAHVSSLETSEDRGINSIAISARWFPFR